ncbi:hypothetical protein AAVH_26736, partial [Aphelenchoides avenae]
MVAVGDIMSYCASVCTVVYCLSVSFFIARMRKTDRQFSSAFFTLYAIVNVNLAVLTLW